MQDNSKGANEYGAYRSIEPTDAFPILAWKLDTSLPIRNDEILIKVKIININAASFDQITGSVDKTDPIEIAKKISSIVSLRGKLHNPITGTGGTMMGVIEEIGVNHPEYGHAEVGDEVCTLMSTSMSPLVLNKITQINMHTRQIEVEGYAILFRDSYFSKVPKGWDPHIYLAIVGEAGSCYESALRCRPDSTVMLIGASEKVGLMSMFAIREKLRDTGMLIVVTRYTEQYEELKQLKVADMVIVADFRNPIEAYRTIERALPSDTVIDYTVDCASSNGHEMLAVFMTRERGMVYFASPATSYSEASLGAEGIAKEMDLIFYRGFIKGHTAFCMRLVDEYPQILKWFKKRYAQDRRNGIYNINASIDEIGKSHKDLRLPNVVVSGPEMSKVIDTARRVAGYNTTVLIQGESGTGKEVIADVIKQLSDRNRKVYIKINCAAIAENLFESEFFGYEGGAFTGALKNGKAGHFENADGGTLFLDEIGELSLQNQVKLLRVLQQKEVVRVGASKAKKVDVRLIAATNKDLRAMVSKGQFREDLFYRLNIINIRIPPLRERRGDIRALVENFTINYNDLYGMHKSFDRDTLYRMQNYSWPGNVRELENLVQRMMLVTENDVIDTDSLPDEIRSTADNGALSVPAAMCHSVGLADTTTKYKTALDADTMKSDTDSNAADYENAQGAAAATNHERISTLGDMHSCAESEIVSLNNKNTENEHESEILLIPDEEARYRKAVNIGKTTREIAALLHTSQPTVVRRLKKYGLTMRH